MHRQPKTHKLLASKRSERDTTRGVQIRAGEVYWRASEASETLSGVTNGNRRYIYIYIYLITLIPRNITSQLRCIVRLPQARVQYHVTDE